MAAKTPAPAPQEKRLAAYLEWLAQAAGHADRTEPLRNYCTGLLLDGERKSVEPMAARLAPDHVQRMHESLHHFVALETIFANIRQALSSDGFFLADEMIGRNGHMRWPETLELIQGILKFIPDHYKTNHLKRVEHEYVN